MVDAVRITHQYAEVVSSGSDADAVRITHQYAEVIYTVPTAIVVLTWNSMDNFGGMR